MKAAELTAMFERFFSSEKSAGMLLVACTAVSLLLANSPLSGPYQEFWQFKLLGQSITHWINDGLMAIFFLLIGLELERELYSGELSRLDQALLPIVAAIGGMVVPALVHFAFNKGAVTQVGFGIPMATDIAFALAVLALLADRIPPALKVLVVAFAVIDDLGAIIIIASFYTANISLLALLAALAVWGILLILNRRQVMVLWPYLTGGIGIWLLLLQSGVHATIAGVMLAFAIPFTAKIDDQQSPSHRLEHLLHKPVAYFILPLFAFANTGVSLGPEWANLLTTPNSLGILFGLVLGKPLGVSLFCAGALGFGLCKLPRGLHWPHLLGAGLLGGIGFTMSIFITNLAFEQDESLRNASKIAVLLASLIAGTIAYIWLRMIKPSS